MKHPTLLSMSLSVGFITTIFFFTFIISIPTSHGNDEEPNYSICKKTYDCGEQIKEIGYPFWGGDRPLSCGVQGFNLSCHGNDYTTIDVDSQTYRVLKIHQDVGSMTIARIDLWDTICPEKFADTALNFNLFDYSHPYVINLTLLYDCPPSVASDLLPKRNHFTCSSAANGNNINFFVETERHGPPSFPECKSRFMVPVLKVVYDAFWRTGSIMTLQELVKGGFGVQYHELKYFRACGTCNASGGVCGSGTTNTTITNEGICFCPNGPSQSQSFQCPGQGGKKQLTMIIVIVISIVGAAILVTCASLIFCLRKKTSSFKSIFIWRKSTVANDNVEAFFKINGSTAPQRYSYSSIKKLTNSFQDKLGKGGYGAVYKGKLFDGRPVAVKLLNETKDGNGEEFINEVSSISRTSHVNIVSLVGYCFEGPKRALIYEYMPNGSLEKFIYNNKPQQGNNGLEWKTMHKIAVGVARGLEYLHRGCTTRIFHFDIKPHNILLDEEFCPKISDFGLAKLCPKKESIVSMLHARGTIGYIAPEVFSRYFGRVSHKADVYSYGMLVLEMVRGRENIDNSVKDTSDLYFPHSIYKKLECEADMKLYGIESAEDEKVARKMILVGLCCIQANPLERPAINKVIEMLEGNLESLQLPPEPFLSSPPRSPIASSTIQISEGNESSEIELL